MSRSRRQRVRRRRAVALLVLAALVATLVGLVLAEGGRHGEPAARPPAGSAVRSRKVAAAPAAAESGLLPWQLAAPISREVVVPDGPSPLLRIAGGLDEAGSSVTGVYSLDTRQGRLRLLGNLARPTHDAAGAVLGGVLIVAGGGSAVPVATTERVGADGRSLLGAGLPAPRADAAAVTIGATGYVVGGYGGDTMDSQVLVTRDGVHYRSAARLLVPVRYPALAVADGRILVFGGATRSGRPLRIVEAVDPATGTARRAGVLPFALAGAVAANLGGTIYLAGGDRGNGSTRPSNAIFAFEPSRGAFLRAGSLQVAVANGGAAVSDGRLWIVGGETANGRPSADVQVVFPNRRFGLAGLPGAGSPFYGDRLLIADRGNNRLLVLDDTGRIVWRYPSASRAAPPGGFYFPDDAFFFHHGSAIVTNQEDNDTIAELAFPSGRVLFQYGHARRPGSAPGYLDSPDDAYVLADGNITVADSVNCRVLVLDPHTRRIVEQLGRPGACAHAPPGELASPNGDTPLADGDLLVSEVNGSWIDELTPRGRLVWDVQLPIGYPSDPQQLAPDRYLVADYEHPGGIVEFTRRGRILYRYAPAGGSGELNHPSLVERVPSGAFLLNDDENDRMVAIDPGSGALVWSYGVTGRAGTAPGLLNTPDGFDLLTRAGTMPTHPTTG